jgi:hypothetical protein
MANNDNSNKLTSLAAYTAALRELYDSTPDRLSKASAEEFNDVINKAITNDPMKKANITPYSTDDYSKFKNFLSADKQSGYAVKPGSMTDSGKDELISVFSNKRGRGPGILEHAVDTGGAKQLDAFDINNKLPSLYGKEFKETYRYKFDPKYAPEDWNYEKVGTPDVIGMELDPEKMATRTGRQVGKSIAKFGLPAIAAGLALNEPTLDDAIMNTLVPGGVESLGSEDEDTTMRGEVKGYKNYKNSPAAAARRAALEKLGK